MSIVKDTIAITAITLVAGLALGVVQDITEGPIAQQQEQSKQEAYKAVFEDADSFEPCEVDADALAANLAENNFNAQTINEVMEAKDASGETIGYALNVTDSEGYGGDIQFTMGIQNDGTFHQRDCRTWYEGQKSGFPGSVQGQKSRKIRVHQDRGHI